MSHSPIDNALTMKVEFYDRYLWSTQVAAIGDGSQTRYGKPGALAAAPTFAR